MIFFSKIKFSHLTGKNMYLKWRIYELGNSKTDEFSVYFFFVTQTT